MTESLNNVENRQASWKSRILALSLLLAACGAAYWIGNRSAFFELANGGLTTDEANLDFGTVWEDRAFIWQLPIENRGPSDVRVVEFVSSCGCVSVVPPSMEIPSGQTRSVRLELNLTYRAAQASGKDAEAEGEPRKFSVKIGAAVQKADGGSPLPIIWTIWGRVRPAVLVDRRAVGFGDAQVEGQPPPTRIVNVKTHACVDRLKATCMPDHATALLSPLPNDRTQYTLTIRPHSNLKAGPWKCSVILEPKRGEQSLPRFIIPVQGRVTEDIQATPAVIAFGARALGAKVCETIVLRSWTGAPFEVEKVVCDAKDLAVEPRKAEAALKEYRITQHVRKRENQSCSVSFYVRAKNSRPRVIAILVCYFGIGNIGNKPKGND